MELKDNHFIPNSKKQRMIRTGTYLRPDAIYAIFFGWSSTFSYIFSEI